MNIFLIEVWKTVWIIVRRVIVHLQFNSSNHHYPSRLLNGDQYFTSLEMKILILNT